MMVVAGLFAQTKDNCLKKSGRASNAKPPSDEADDEGGTEALGDGDGEAEGIDEAAAEAEGEGDVEVSSASA